MQENYTIEYIEPTVDYVDPCWAVVRPNGTIKEYYELLHDACTDYPHATIQGLFADC